MIIYSDLVGDSHDELFSDTYPMTEEFEGTIIKAKLKLKTEKTEINDAMFGGNASAEGCDDDAGADPSEVSGLDCCMAHRMVQTKMDKKAFKAYIKKYMGSVLDHIKENCPDREKCFKVQASKFVAEMLTDFGSVDLYMGEHSDWNGMLAMVRWETQDCGDEIPYMYLWKDGLIAEKV